MLIEGLNLTKIFSSGLMGSRKTVAVDDVSVKIDRNETLALVGESGSGKSTLGKLLLFLIEPTAGKVIFDGITINRKNVRKLRRRMQYIPQHPEDSLDPRWKIADSLLEPLRIHGLPDENLHDLVEMVGLGEEHLCRYPHELSGGELQRVAIARALSLSPDFVVCDEPTSMLDVSVQASIINLLLKLQRKFGLSYLFITHDLELAEIVADRVAVMYRGEIVEEGYGVLKDPLHPYTRALVEGNGLDGETVSTDRFCKFYRLCPDRSDVCQKFSGFVSVNGRRVKCALYAKR